MIFSEYRYQIHKILLWLPCNLLIVRDLMGVITKNKIGNKAAINPAQSFVEYSANINVENMSFKNFLAGIKKFVSDEAFSLGASINEASFNKCNGDWYEWLVAISAIEYFIKNKNSYLLVKMPNTTSFDIMSVYEKELWGYIHDLRKKLDCKNVNLITSNPDFAIIDVSRIKQELVVLLNDISFKKISLHVLNQIDNLYRNFVNFAKLDEVVAYLSVKTTFRPDRRLQLAHEGSLMKALYTHLQTRTWNIDPKGIKYYAAATSIGKADETGLKTVATHSITDVKSLPQSAVDNIFKINSVQDVRICLNQIFSS